MVQSLSFEFKHHQRYLHGFSSHSAAVLLMLLLQRMVSRTMTSRVRREPSVANVLTASVRSTLAADAVSNSISLQSIRPFLFFSMLPTPPSAITLVVTNLVETAELCEIEFLAEIRKE